MDPMCDDIVAVGDTRVCKEHPIEIGISKVIDGERIVFLSGSRLGYNFLTILGGYLEGA